MTTKINTKINEAIDKQEKRIRHYEKRIAKSQQHALANLQDMSKSNPDIWQDKPAFTSSFFSNIAKEIEFCERCINEAEEVIYNLEDLLED